jgi:hypothetical protein
MVAKIVRKVDRIDITTDGEIFTVFDGLSRKGSFATETAAVNFAIDISKKGEIA